jgi:hypothetical protein
MEFEGASNGNTDAMIEDILPSKLKKKKANMYVGGCRILVRGN